MNNHHHHDSHSDEHIRKILSSMKNVAVVGISKNPKKAAHYVPKYLMSQGYNIMPVSPTADEILGEKCCSSIDEITTKIDIVDVFRPSDQVLPIIEQAIVKEPHVIWLQKGIHDSKAEELAQKQGIDVVFNRCMYEEHKRLF